MAIRRIALIFDDKLRPETTGYYCLRALRHFVEVEHFRPDELATVPRTGFDLYLNIDDGLRYQIPSHLRPSAWWAIDTHMDLAWAIEKSSTIDFSFAAQRDGANQLVNVGCRTVWLPLACDPEIHRPRRLENRWDVCFVGRLAEGPRSELLERLAASFSRSFIGECYFDEYAQRLSESHVGFNRSVSNDINMRVFETLACGPLLLTNDLSENGQEELLQADRHLVTYQSCDEMLDKIRFYLRSEVLRKGIAQAGNSEVLRKHTYANRMRTILTTIEKELSRSSLSVDLPIDSPVSPARAKKDCRYFEFDRPEVVARIPLDARQVLDIGCGAGRLGERLKRRQNVRVTGVELDPRAAQCARQRLDRVLEQNIEAPDFQFTPGSFDCIVCADVLEHLRDPASIIQKIRLWLRPGGSLVISLPNVRHHSVVSSLLDGNWTYETAGLLDDDHARFFTRREIEKLLFRQSFEIHELIPLPGPGHREWVAAGRPDRVAVGALTIDGLAPESAEEFFTYQFLVVARPAAPDCHPTPLRARTETGAPPDETTRTEPNHFPSLEESPQSATDAANGSIPLSRGGMSNFGLTSIIIVTFNEIAFTIECVDSIRSKTDEPYELIFVDNGSTDDTVAYLNSLADVQIIQNSENRGFPAAVNQGLKVARGNQVLLLNNDTVVSTGWLRRLLCALRSDPRIGLVGPCSNNVYSEQVIQVNYGEIASMDGFAWDWGKQNSGVTLETDRLIGFCLLIRKEVLDTIGGLDERFGIGCFEDDDICRRAMAAGWKLVIARDSFVHHYGSRTFIASGVDYTALMRENQIKYRQKWDRPIATTSNSSDRQRFELKSATGGGLLLTTRQPRLSLCMIVRNNESTIRPCLESIGPWVDEMIVVDTGSTDATPEICEELGARVFHWAWQDDFSAARNQSLLHATGEWIFWMDSDDTITEECGRQLRQLADGEHPDDLLGYIIQVHCPGPGEDAVHDVTAVDHVKLIRNRPDLRFEHRIHEQILPAIRRAGGNVAFTELYVVHSGSDHSPDGRARKLERDFKLLNLDLKERPDHPFILFNLGMTCADVQQHLEAVQWLTRCLEVSTPGESHVRKAYALLISSLVQLRDIDHAALACDRGRQLFPEDKELLFRDAMLCHETGDLDGAVRRYREVLTPARERHFASVDIGLAGYKARHNLALVYEDQGHLELAQKEWRTILDEQPEYLAAQIGLIECLLRTRDSRELQQRIADLRSKPSTAAVGIRLEAKRLEAAGEIDASIAELQRGLKNGDDIELLRELARLYHSRHNYSDSLNSLNRLLAVAPNDVSSWHNRGVILGLVNQEDESRQAFARAEELRLAKPRRISTPSNLST